MYMNQCLVIKRYTKSDNDSYLHGCNLVSIIQFSLITPHESS